MVILDLMMPEMDGFQFLRKFRDIPAYRHVPVIVVTAKDLSAAERRELRNMSSEIILKSKSGLKETLATLTSQVIKLRTSLPGGGSADG
jgi:CheY-like chemotaxis protein